MEQVQRSRWDREEYWQNQGGGPGAEGDGDLATMNRQARSLLDAGRQAIDRALSQDSGRFLRESNQRGGQ